MLTSAQPNITLLLHFDVNKTVIMKGSGKSNSFVIQEELAGCYRDIWEEGMPEMTYHEYVTKQKLAPYKGTDEYRVKVIYEIENFISDLQKRNHHFYDEVKKKHDYYLEKLNSQGNLDIVPSFYKALNWLESIKREYKIQDFKILIRTFGKDRNAVVKELRENAHLRFISAEFNTDGQFTLKVSDYPKAEFQSTDLSAIYKYWMNTDQHIAIQDDYNRWAHNEKNWMYGKAYPLERSNKQTVSIFFDDNIEVDKDSKTNIVTPFDVETGQYVAVSAIVEEGFAYTVEPFKAIEDENYFISLIQKTLENSNRIFTPMRATQVNTFSESFNPIAHECEGQNNKVGCK